MLMGISTIIFNGCKKPKDGEPGPAGNANVQAYIYTAYTSDWILSSSYWYCNYYRSMNDNSAVMVYWGVNTNEWVALPFTVTDTEFYFKTTTTQVQLDVRSASGTKSIPNPGIMTFKIVIIPPAFKKKGLDLTNYNSVKTEYNLQD